MEETRGVSADFVWNVSAEDLFAPKLPSTRAGPLSADDLVALNQVSGVVCCVDQFDGVDLSGGVLSRQDTSFLGDPPAATARSGVGGAVELQDLIAVPTFRLLDALGTDEPAIDRWLRHLDLRAKHAVSQGDCLFSFLPCGPGAAIDVRLRKAPHDLFAAIKGGG